jgi:tetratricopeptide (TPR) repeat protein
VSAFIRASTDAAAPAELASAICELTGGTPLLLCELWRDLREIGAVEISDARVRLSRPIAELRGPERLRHVVRQRLSRLAPETAAALELAAVIGPRFELRVLADAAQLDWGALATTVEETIRNGLIEELPEPVPAYRFTHELVRRAVYDGIAHVHRAELHLRVGEALERVHAADLARVLPALAHHFILAAPVAGVQRAIDYNLRAADATLVPAAYAEAAASLSTALELGIGDPHERARVQLELGYLLYELGQVPESDAILTASVAAATGLAERGLMARALVQRASQRLFSNPEVDPEEMRTVAEVAMTTFDELRDSRGLAGAGRLLALVLRRQGRLAESCAEIERALMHADACGHQPTRRRLIGTLVYALCDGPTPVAEAISRCEHLLRANRNDRMLEAVAMRSLSALFAMAGRFDEAREHLRTSSLVLDESDALTPSWAYRRIAAEAKELAGDRAGAEQELTAKWQSLRGTGGSAPHGLAMQAANQLALLYCAEGRWDDAADCLAYSHDVPEPAGFFEAAAIRLAASARLAAHHGQLAEAVMLAERAVAHAEPTDMLNFRARVWLALAEVHRAGGAAAEADTAVAAAVRLYDSKGNVAAAAPLRAAAESVAT